MSGRDDGDDDSFADERERLVAQLRSRESVDEGVLDAMRTVPRHAFVPDAPPVTAYEDRPLPIGAGQTVSAPHMVAIMTSLLDVDVGDDVLEVGTGCGYHAAVTAEVIAPGTLYSVEYEPSLAERAADRLADLGYDNVRVRRGDGHEGWPEHAPYDAAYLTCAPTSVPERVIEQVRVGGRVVAPVGDVHQRLVKLTVRGDGVDEEGFGGVRFVPMQ